MTLVAAFLSEGSPTLIGDLLVTSDQTHGSRKKLQIITERLAVGWSGHQFAASSVIRELSNLKSESINRDSLAAVLTTPETADLGTLQVTLIGWVVDRQGVHCFRWDSSNSSRVEFSAPQFDGTGQKSIERLIGTHPEGIRRVGREELSDGDIRSTLYYTTSLMKAEMIGPSTRHMGFGLGYEIAMYRNGKFGYVDDILYVSVCHDFDGDGHYLRSGFIGRTVKYEAQQNEVRLHVLDQVTNTIETHAIQSALTSAQSAYLTNITDCVSESRQGFPFTAVYYCVFVTLRSPGFSSPPIVMTFLGNTEPKDIPLVVTHDGQLQNNLSKSKLENTYQLIHGDWQREVSERRSSILVEDIDSLRVAGRVELAHDNSRFELEYPLFYNVRVSADEERAVLLPNHDFTRFGLHVAGTPAHLPKRDGITKCGRINDAMSFGKILAMMESQLDDVIFVASDKREIVFTYSVLGEAMRNASPIRVWKFPKQ